MPLSILLSSFWMSFWVCSVCGGGSGGEGCVFDDIFLILLSTVKLVVRFILFPSGFKKFDFLEGINMYLVIIDFQGYSRCINLRLQNESSLESQFNYSK